MVWSKLPYTCYGYCGASGINDCSRWLPWMATVVDPGCPTVAILNMFREVWPKAYQTEKISCSSCNMAPRGSRTSEEVGLLRNAQTPTKVIKKLI